MRAPQTMGGSDHASVCVVTVVKDPDDRQLMATMRSVARQTHPDVRQVLVDGGSSGIGARLARRRWPMKEFVLMAGPDRGIYDAMNQAVLQASGDHLLFLNSADTLEPRALERMVNAARGASPEAIVYCDYRFGGTDMSAPSQLDDAFDFYNMGVAHQALLVRRSAFARIGPYRTDFRIVSDHLWMRDARDQGLPFVHLPERLVCIDDRGLSSAGRAEDLACFEAEAARRVTMRFEFVPDDVARALFRFRRDEAAWSAVAAWLGQVSPAVRSAPAWPRFVRGLAAYQDDVRLRCRPRAAGGRSDGEPKAPHDDMQERPGC